MNLKDKIRIIEDFPREGIKFKDITPLLQDGRVFKETINQMKQWSENLQADIIVGPEARGFMFGTALAYSLEVGFVPVRKPGKLPCETIAHDYTLEYGQNTLEMHKDAIKPGEKVVIVDDLLATGGTLLSTAKLIEKLGGQVVGIITLIELSYLNGRELLSEYKIQSLMTF